MPTNDTRRSYERGIGLIELIVGMVIIAMILAIGLSLIRSSRSAGNLTVAVAVAQDYAAAADLFKRDHNGRYPGAPGSADWPGGADARKGPRSLVLGNKTYLRQVPEPVQSGNVVLGPRGTAAAGITYSLSGPGYQILVQVKDRSDCVLLGGGAPEVSGTPTCSKR